MKRQTPKAILHLKSLAELSAAEKALDERNYPYKTFEDAFMVEVYVSLTAQDWSALIAAIENNSKK